MMIRLLLIVGIILSVVDGSLSAQAPAEHEQVGRTEHVYDGRWWTEADLAEQSGFLNGAADCLTWVAHAKWLTATVEALEKKITQYYQMHPAERAEPIAEVWKKLVSTSRATPSPAGGEVWKNPHGYYNGLWWRQGSDNERLGFLEGYLWCLHTCVERPAEAYSKPAGYYVDKIDSYIQRFPRGNDEPIATILSRFRDKSSRK